MVSSLACLVLPWRSGRRPCICCCQHHLLLATPILQALIGGITSCITSFLCLPGCWCPSSVCCTLAGRFVEHFERRRLQRKGRWRKWTELKNHVRESYSMYVDDQLNHLCTTRPLLNTSLNPCVSEVYSCVAICVWCVCGCVDAWSIKVLLQEITSYDLSLVS